MSGAIDLGLDSRTPTSGTTPKRPERRSGIMHEGTKDPERTRAMRGFDSEHPGRRSVAGTAAYVGILAGGLLATSHPIVTAISVAIAGGAAWSVRRLTHESSKADGSFRGRNELKTPGERTVTVSTERGRR